MTNPLQESYDAENPDNYNYLYTSAPNTENQFRARYDKGQDKWFASKGTLHGDGVMSWSEEKEKDFDSFSKGFKYKGKDYGFNYSDQGEYADTDILAEGIFDYNPNKTAESPVAEDPTINKPFDPDKPIEKVVGESNTMDADKIIQNTGAQASVNANEASMSSPNSMMDAAYSNEGTTVNPSQVEGQNIANANKNLINQQNQQQNNKFEFKWHTPQYSNFM